MIRGTPSFGDLFQEILQPYKYGPRMYDSDVGTEDDPSIIVRSEMIQKKYKAWRSPDGSYHEVLIKEGFLPDKGGAAPTKPELTD